MSSKRYQLKETTRALTRTGGFLRGFAFSLNPYAGCAFGDAGGCPFCYVRMLPVAHGEKSPWGSWVIAKSNLAERLERELAALEHSGRLAGTTIFMSSATDPYQGIERSLKLTRAALEAFVRHPMRRLLIQTRSPIIERDLDLITALGNRAIVSITIETDDDNVRRAISPTSPSVERRLKTARMFRKHGVFTQIAIAPMMPNHPERFACLIDDAADRVIVDTYFDGDGARGARSTALGIGELYARRGYEGWFRRGAERELLAAMRSRLGEHRVLFSGAGFNAV
ncbi:MAG: radical SAM protein [Candidatus Binatus sp.]|uniref:SPL family radical SAM protein n=1 Tax=Candidatus Binatus sp. TaxID=2811406 RepID=UPI002728B45C|nr:radical SAM protein [Candidatus Binatus sp.]MDO8432885.1 radical SAM protein [Candidatus Binatus sp.]